MALIPIRGRPLLSSTPPIHLLPQPSTPLPSLGSSSSPLSFLPDTASTPLFHRVDDVFLICRPQQLPSPAPSLLCEAAVKAQCPSHSEPNPPYLRRIRPRNLRLPNITNSPTPISQPISGIPGHGFRPQHPRHTCSFSMGELLPIPQLSDKRGYSQRLATRFRSGQMLHKIQLASKWQQRYDQNHAFRYS